MVSIIGDGLYGMMFGYGSGGSGSIPGRLRIKSADARISSGNPAIIGIRGHEIIPEYSGDMIAIHSYGQTSVENSGPLMRVQSPEECTVYDDDYIISRSDLYAISQDDGLLICFTSNITFEIEKEKRGK